MNQPVCLSKGSLLVCGIRNAIYSTRHQPINPPYTALDLNDHSHVTLTRSQRLLRGIVLTMRLIIQTTVPIQHSHVPRGCTVLWSCSFGRSFQGKAAITLPFWHCKTIMPHIMLCHKSGYELCIRNLHSFRRLWLIWRLNRKTWLCC